jgi:hypothetical protein
MFYFSGSIILDKTLDYEVRDEHIITVTASDGVHVSLVLNVGQVKKRLSN